MVPRAGLNFVQRPLLCLKRADRVEKSPQRALCEDLPPQPRDRVSNHVSYVCSEVSQNVPEFEHGWTPASSKFVADAATLARARVDQRQILAGDVVENILKCEVAVKLPARPTFLHRGRERATD